MKLTAVFIALGFFQLQARSVAQTVTFTGRDIPLQQVFSTVEKQTGYYFFYNESMLEETGPVTLEAVNMPLESFLSLLFHELPLKYSIKKKAIIISRKPQPLPVSDEPAADVSQGMVISGMIYDEKTRTPVAGANVVVNASGKATQTDERGMFTLKDVNENDQITISSIGYQKLTVVVGKKNTFLTLFMKVAVSELDQAVVQGYGVTSRRFATGNIAKISGEEIRKQPVMNTLMALQGRVPGMVVTPTRGNASSPVKVEIRGKNALNPNFFSDPLYVIDGIPQTVLDVNPTTAVSNRGVSPGIIQGGSTGLLSPTGGQSPLFSLNPNDIESIEVLIDGDATAIYGSRAANGVILITTRRAKPGKTALELSVRQGIVMARRFPDMLSTPEYLAIRHEAFQNDGIVPTAANAPDLMAWDTTRQTNWTRNVLGVGKNTAVSASLRGGNNGTSFSLSTGYDKQIDLFNISGSNQRGTLSLAVDHRSPNQKLGMRLSANYGVTKVDAANDNTAAFTLPPDAPPIYNAQGALNFDDWNAVGIGSQYPFAYLLSPTITTANSLTSSLRISYELIKGLSFIVTTGYNNMQSTNNFFSPIASQNPQRNLLGVATFGSTTNNSVTMDPQLQYSRLIGKGDLTAMIGGSWQNTGTLGTTIQASGYTNDDLIRSIAGSASQSVSEWYSKYKTAAAFARLTYRWDSKYVLNINVRRDGSSRFAPGKQFGNFGSVGVSWIASEESWMKKLLPAWFSFVKLRGSYAVTGGDGIGDYQYLSQWSTKGPGGYLPMYTYNGIQPYAPIHAVNQQYQWEGIKNLEGALDMAFLDERINLGLDWYRKRAGNQLTSLPTPVYTGFSSVTANWAATVQNSGLDVRLSAMVVKQKDLSVSVSFNINNNKNKLVSYPGLASSTYATKYKIGQSLSEVYVFKYLGVDPMTGAYNLEDHNKDGKVYRNTSVIPGTRDDDRYIALDLAPKYAGGFGTDVRYKNLGLSLFFNYVNQLGTNPYNDITPGSMKNFVVPEEIVRNHWRKPGDKAEFARYSTGSLPGYGITLSDRGYADASFLQLNNIAFTYSLPARLAKKASMQSCDFSINAQNVFMITRYKIDPEVQKFANTPVPRIITGSLLFNF